jgi:hypothetical protein
MRSSENTFLITFNKKTQFVRDASNLVTCALPSSTIIRKESSAEHWNALITDKAATVGFQDGSGNFPLGKKAFFCFHLLDGSLYFIASCSAPAAFDNCLLMVP